MGHVYTNKSSGQVVKSEKPLPRFEGVARWEHTEEKPKQSAKK